MLCFCGQVTSSIFRQDLATWGSCARQSDCSRLHQHLASGLVARSGQHAFPLQPCCCQHQRSRHAADVAEAQWPAAWAQRSSGSDTAARLLAHSKEFSESGRVRMRHRWPLLRRHLPEIIFKSTLHSKELNFGQRDARENSVHPWCQCALRRRQPKRECCLHATWLAKLAATQAVVEEAMALEFACLVFLSARYDKYQSERCFRLKLEACEFTMEMERELDAIAFGNRGVRPRCQRLQAAMVDAVCIPSWLDATPSEAEADAFVLCSEELKPDLESTLWPTPPYATADGRLPEKIWPAPEAMRKQYFQLADNVRRLSQQSRQSFEKIRRLKVGLLQDPVGDDYIQFVDAHDVESDLQQVGAVQWSHGCPSFWVEKGDFIPHRRRPAPHQNPCVGDICCLRLRRRRDLNKFLVAVIEADAFVDESAAAAIMETSLVLTAGGCYHALRLVSRQAGSTLVGVVVLCLLVDGGDWKSRKMPEMQIQDV